MAGEVPKADKPPPMVRLCHNAATILVEERLWRIVSIMAPFDDPDLDIGAATGVLLAVSMELIIRMRQFAGYPPNFTRLGVLSKIV